METGQELPPSFFPGKMVFLCSNSASLSSLQAGIWWHRLPEGPWGRRSAMGTAGDFSSAKQLHNSFCWQTLSWLDLCKEWVAHWGLVLKGWMGDVLIILSAASASQIFYDELRRACMCFVKSPSLIQFQWRSQELTEPSLTLSSPQTTSKE